MRSANILFVQLPPWERPAGSSTSSESYCVSNCENIESASVAYGEDYRHIQLLRQRSWQLTKSTKRSILLMPSVFLNPALHKRTLKP